MGGATPDVSRRTLVTAALLGAVVAAASGVAWALAYPQSSLPVTLVRAVSDCAAVVCLGLAVVPMLDDERYRCELIGRATAPLTASGALWLVAELGRLIGTAAQTAAVPVWRLGLPTAVDFARETAAGRAGMIGVVVAAAVCVVALAAPRTPPLNLVVAGLAAVGVTARLVTGHFFESALGGLAVAVHILAAALWCGALAGLVLTVRHRGQWARVLPRFSQLSLWCVLALLLGGVVGAGERLGSPAELYATGYGRLLSAKIVVAAVLVLLGWRNRSIWVPAARAHRSTAVVSRSRSLVELAVMAVALALAAGLAASG
ncbi:copper resistance D family protein [Mycobacterium barrassiae]|uniref:copper resistance D family protein n=1 Tax=Mycobacterium barrassiae TaxID=319709 RepID=UPI002265C545|nr:CopD family protein [Mycobacterium barrassiae]